MPKINKKKYFVTGGSGFIGSHIVDELIKRGNFVTVYDNFSTGQKLFTEHHLSNPNFKLIEEDVLNSKILERSMAGHNFVFHMSAHADVRSGFEDHFIDHVQNLEATQAVLEAMVKNSIKKISFASTSSVYGEAKKHPTPEEEPFLPTSLYGSTKAACENYIATYSSYYGWNSYIFRFVSWTGERYTHGIVVDLIKKLKKNQNEVELISDGTPKKSSLYVKDGVNAIFTILEKSKETVNIFNIGHKEVLTIDNIVDIIFDELKVKPNKKYLGGKRGWKGDNNFVLLSSEKLEKLGWEPKFTIEEGIRKTIRYLVANPNLIK